MPRPDYSLDHHDALTATEFKAIGVTVELANLLGSVVDDGPTRDADLAELFGHLHDIQHAIMAQAAARVFPQEFRLLGKVIE